METYTRDGINVSLFDSAAEFAMAAKPHAINASDWTGSTEDGAYNACVKGDLACVPEAEKMIDKISANVETTRSVWIPAVAGVFPIVPEYLMGYPQSMRRRTHVANENAPLRIYLDLTSSGGINEKSLAKRGIAFLALAMLLTRMRPVEMHAFTALGSRGGSGNGIVSIKLPTAPLDIAIAGGIFTQGVARTLGYGYINSVRRTEGAWLNGITPFRVAELVRYIEIVRAALGAGPEDIIIGPVYLNDETINNPIKFVQGMINKHSQEDDDEIG